MALEFPPGAVWIGSDHPFDLHEAYLRFRSPRTWQLDHRPQQATLAISADSRYKLWINGAFVARGPARSYPHAQCVDELDVASFLQAGVNTLAVHVYQPGYSHFSYVHRAAAGLLAHLTCDGETALVTDASWRTRRDPSFSADVPRISIYLGGVEDRDLRRADPWTAPDYDDEAWAAARIVAPVGRDPWTGLQPRAVPLLQEREHPLQLVETRRGPSPAAAREDVHLALRAAWQAASPATPAAEDGWYAPSLDDGEWVFWVYDLGRGYACQGWAEVRGAGGEETVVISYSEKEQDGAIYLSDPATYCRVRMSDRYRLRAGNQQVQPFALRGGRFLLFALQGPTSPDLQIRWHCTVAEYPLSVTHPLATPDPMLSQIVTLCEETLRACLLDGYVDNPWRESAQWTGDALPDTLVMASMCDDLRPARRVIELAAQGATSDGVLPGVVPGEAHAYTVVDFNFAWVELLHFYVERTEDAAFLKEMWPTLARMLQRFMQDVNDEGLLVSQIGRRLFMDWAPVSRNEPNAIYNLHFLLALQLAVELAEKRGAAAEAEHWTSCAASLRESIRSTFWNGERWHDDEEQTTFSQLATALALITGAAQENEAPPLLEALAARSLDDDDEHDPQKMVLASPFMHHRVFQALRRHEKYEDVVQIIRRRWGRWVDGGYPTTWENWNVDFPDGSQCHGFSAHPRYHLAEISREVGL